jgi:uncharacterized protein (TIGR03083 family)
MSENRPMNKQELLASIQKGWDDFNAFLATLTEEQITVPTDAGGWTAKDHVMHLAVWEDGINALLDKQSRHAHMGLDTETWESRDFDRMNAVIQQLHRDRSWPDVLKAFRDNHERLVKKVESLSDEDLARPYRYYQPDSTMDDPVVNRIAGNTFGHYAEHQPWIAALVTRA